ncbi:CLIP domain-containing serine protease HP8-like [Cylas formicarius]|uniref:CLIP domain-containing serine protease HP8-like n=1 Tax=Cylas formicarius TaxID=197179 RepID=UPI00295884AF|nr:CLIP domain-containing serine protease HP8-like [Cylas formicarius]
MISANIKPICLPVSEINDDLTGKSAIVSGWGATEKDYKSPILLKVSVPVLSLSVCHKVYQQFASITDQQICAGGYNDRDSCGGDSGGPMKYVGLVDGSPRYIQYGILSFGPRQCGADGQPGIYTRVGSYIQWILDNMEE